MPRSITIAIDGPASSGKGTVARTVARRLNYAYIDTGAMYRSVALAAQRRGLDLAHADELGQLTTTLEFQFRWSDSGLRIIVNGEDFGCHPPETVGKPGRGGPCPLRAALLERQRAPLERAG